MRYWISFSVQCAVFSDGGFVCLYVCVCLLKASDWSKFTTTTKQLLLDSLLKEIQVKAFQVPFLRVVIFFWGKASII